MADDDSGEVAGSNDPTEPPQRRATFTPPPVSDGGVHDDDALADALAAEFARIASGPIGIVPPASQPDVAPDVAVDVAPDVAVEQPVAPPADTAPAEPAWEPEPWAPPAAEQSGWEPAAWEAPAERLRENAPPAENTVAEPAPVAASERAPAAPAEPERAPAAPAEPERAPSEPERAPSEPFQTPPAPEPAQPAWMNLPAPDPAQAVDLPEGPPQRPVRRSLPDEALAGWADDAAKDGGTLSVIEELEAQLKLREEEAREFHAWEQTMRAVGTPDAISEVEHARPEFTGVLPDDGEPGTAGMPPAAEPTGEPEPSDSVESAEEDAPEELYRPPTGWFIPAAIDDAPTEQEPTEPDSTEPESLGGTEAPELATEDVPLAPGTGAFVVPEAPLAAWPAPSWDVEPAAPLDGASSDPAPSDDGPTRDGPADASPVWNLDVDEPEPVTPEAEPEPEPQPEPVTLEAEPEPEPEPETFFLPEPSSEPLHPTHPVDTIARGDRVEPTADDSASPFAPPPFAPPPLVEPPLTGSTPEDARPAAPADGVLPDPAPEIVREGGFPLGEQFFAASGVDAASSTFDDLLASPPEEGEPLGVDPDAPPRLPVETLFIEPLTASATEPPVTTGSVSIIDQAYEEELDDDVDETDRVVQAFGPVSVDTAGIAIVPPPISPPSGPISTVRIREDEAVLAAAPPRQPVFSLEASGVEPTPAEYRVGRAARLFWLWFASNSSLLSIGLGAAVFGLGLSLSQSVGAILAGVALSFIPLGLSTLAGKRSGQPTMIVSRATFGLVGNIVPSVLALISRLFWGAVLLWFLATSLAVILVGAELNGSLSERQLLLLGLAGGLAVALVIAFFGYALLARIQLVITIVSSVLVIGLIALTWQYVDLDQALTKPYGSWELTVTGAVLVFSFVGLVWANSAGDLARYQRPESSGPATLLWSPFGVTVPAFVLIAYGALLAASNDGVASGFLLSPLDTLALMLPSWYPVPLLAATILSLLSGVAIALYSGGFALQAIGVRVPRPYAVPVVAVLLAGVTLVITFAVPGGNLELFRDGATTLAVPIAAWAGIFAAEMMIRNRRFESQSLVQRGGVYADVRWLNLIALVLISVIGFGLTTATVTWLSWQGYVFGLLAVPLDGALAGTDLGVIVALVLGLLVPIVAGIPGIRRQEATEVQA